MLNTCGGVDKFKRIKNGESNEVYASRMIGHESSFTNTQPTSILTIFPTRPIYPTPVLFSRDQGCTVINTEIPFPNHVITGVRTGGYCHLTAVAHNHLSNQEIIIANYNSQFQAQGKIEK